MITSNFDRNDLMTLPFNAAPCQCVRVHCPKPLTVEKHHVFPKGLQIKLWGRVRYPQTIPLCGTAHNNIHQCFDMLQDGKAIPAFYNDYIREIARQGFALYTAAREGRL